MQQVPYLLPSGADTLLLAEHQCRTSSSLGQTVAEAVRLQPIVGVHEHEVGLLNRVADLEPSVACLSLLHYWSAGRDHVAGESGGGQYVGRFQCSDISLTAGHDLGEAVEKVRIVVPPLIRLAEIAVF